MKHKTTPILFLLLCTLSYGQSAKEQAFVKTVKQVVLAFSKQDSAALAKFIEPKTGLYQAHLLGVYGNYTKHSTVSFVDSAYPLMTMTQTKDIQVLPLKYARLPVWDCDEETWSKTGLFADTTRTDHLLSNICKERNKESPGDVSQKTIQYFYNLENKSRRLVLFDKNKMELVFYLSYINGKWYLTIVDNYSSDCGA